MKKIVVLLLMLPAICTACGSIKPCKNASNMQDYEVKISVFKDTATWVDGKTYQFIKIRFDGLCLTNIRLAQKHEIAQGTGDVDITIGADSLSCKLPPVATILRGESLDDILYCKLPLIATTQGGERLYLTDDIENYTKLYVSFFYLYRYSYSYRYWYKGRYRVSWSNSLRHGSFYKLLEFDISKIKKENTLSIYPEANKEWYEKWIEENPDFQGERAVREKYLKHTH